MKLIRPALLLASLLQLPGCTSLPDKVTPVQDFQLSRYLGTWHEVARLDHSFEKDLTQVTAQYSMRKDGGVKVVNKGVDINTGKTKQAEGKAYFIDSPEVGRLKVSFFGPFYGSYNIAKLDSDYTMALVIGPSLDYAWILSRSATPSKDMCTAYYQKAVEIGIPKDKWISLVQCKN